MSKNCKTTVHWLYCVYVASCIETNTVNFMSLFHKNVQFGLQR